MHPLLSSNVRKACTRVDGFRLLEFDAHGFCGRPVFTDRPLGCLQDEYLGFHVVPNAVSALLRSLNFLVAASRALDERLHAPSIAMSYSAMYGVLTAYLSLNGRVWFGIRASTATTSGRSSLSSLTRSPRSDTIPFTLVLETTRAHGMPS